MSRPQIIAHRGASCSAPENTIAAFRMALTAGASGSELDVRLASDGVPVVIHDADLRRLAGRTDLIRDLTADELAAVDLGSHFNRVKAKKARPEFGGEGVPTLADVLALFAGTSSTLHIELKIDRKRDIHALVSAVCDILRDAPPVPRLIVSSFALPAIAEVKFRIPHLRTSALFAPSILRVLKRRRHMISLARAFAADGISPHRSLVTRKFVRLATEAGLPVTIWTCDHVKWARTAERFGVAGIITNDPTKFLTFEFND